ncbi:GNAT family N-acetyltransferase [Paenibacillus hemerocallicola]|uniref:GNAT family N-acetyltransferase n=1 Tax=Paenibacillus hemerocallicola TaxID=1172614 RepID=A0A5C4T1T3_9BACL|nr:GNAT family N-acetyltransferase [Paenibacillus hemerocallicola]TNJ62846.1 GNAT family N-acetyltransferase [Paenibacillus hemerocallicola]
MDIVIREITAGERDIRAEIDDSFTVDSTLVLSLTDGKIGYTVKKIPGYEKSYSDEQFAEAAGEDHLGNDDNPNQVMYLAFAEEQVAGRIILRRNWNRYAYVEDIAVHKPFRGLGIGRQLIERARLWAQAGGMPGIMLETQSNNVLACKFYERCGFIIGGFDSQLYRGIHKHNDEIAIFWYLLFE